MAYLKPQSPIQLKDSDYVYPLTTIDQVIDGNQRLNVSWTNYQNTVNTRINGIPTQIETQLNNLFSFDSTTGTLTIQLPS
jgi:hypothetical protein